MARQELPPKPDFMLKKTVLTFAFFTVMTTFYGFNARYGVPAVSPGIDSATYSNPLLREGDYVISAYDVLIRNISEQEGHDWRLLSAIAYHESRFRADLISRQGARGLMQIMPSVARHFSVSAEQASDPETNVWLANQLLTSIDRSLRLPAGTPERDRMSLLLAAYNGGIGHVKDARRLAVAHGENPDSWEVVARYLQLESDPAYYEHEVVTCGRFTGSGRTLAYVDNVLRRYEKYCRMAAR